MLKKTFFTILQKLYLFFQPTSLTNRQAISEALDESFATIDFGPELSSEDEKTAAPTESDGQTETIENIAESAVVITNLEESVTPILNLDEVPEIADWSMRTIPDPPSGFQDSLDMITPAENVPILPGPMKFSIDSYNERNVKEEPYNFKLSRTDSLKQESKEPVKVLTKSESFCLPRFHGDFIAGKNYNSIRTRLKTFRSIRTPRTD